MTVKITIPYYSDCHKGSALPNVRITKKFGTDYATFVKTRTTRQTAGETYAQDLFRTRLELFAAQNPAAHSPVVYMLREASRIGYTVGTLALRLAGSPMEIVASPGATVVAPLFSTAPPPITTPSPMPC